MRPHGVTTSDGPDPGMHKGKLRESGTHQDCWRSGHLHRVYELQFKDSSGYFGPLVAETCGRRRCTLKGSRARLGLGGRGGGALAMGRRATGGGGPGSGFGSPP